MTEPTKQAARAALAWLLATQAPLLASCGSHERSERFEQTTPTTTAPSVAAETSAVAGDTSHARPPVAGPTEAAIVDILRTTNTVAIRSARLARARSSNQAVHAYAVQIVEDHTSANAKLSQVAAQIGVRPEANPTSRMLTQNADHARATFETKRGNTFDRAYIENQIEFHHQVLDLFDRQLIPAAADSEMKALLLTQRSTLEAHLDHASHVQAALAP